MEQQLVPCSQVDAFFWIDQSATATELKIDQVATDLENGLQQLQRMSSKVATDDQSKAVQEQLELIQS